MLALPAEADAAAAGAAPRPIAGTDTRCRGVSWGTGQFALLYEAEWKNRRSITWVGGCRDAVDRWGRCCGNAVAANAR